MLADYTRRGFLDGVGIRLPSIVVRPGKPNKAASGFFSGIIREPLAGQEAILPVPDTRAALAREPTLGGRLSHPRRRADPRAARRPHQSHHAGRVLHGRPNRSRRSGASPATRSPPASAASRTNWWRASSPAGRSRFDPKRALALGFTVEKTFDDIIRAHIEDELGGKIAD